MSTKTRSETIVPGKAGDQGWNLLQRREHHGDARNDRGERDEQQRQQGNAATAHERRDHSGDDCDRDEPNRRNGQQPQPGPGKRKSD